MMNRDYLNFFLRLFLPIAVCGFSLYSYMDKQNALTELRMAIPTVSKEIKMLREENTRLKYEIDFFESPQHLLELAKSCEFSHLKHPLLKEVITVQEGNSLEMPSIVEEEKMTRSTPLFTLAVK
ncbi:MAG: hypothetical protein V4494_01130 [Chlamydiota bacterium]